MSSTLNKLLRRSSPVRLISLSLVVAAAATGAAAVGGGGVSAVVSSSSSFRLLVVVVMTVPPTPPSLPHQGTAGIENWRLVPSSWIKLRKLLPLGGNHSRIYSPNSGREGAHELF